MIIEVLRLNIIFKYFEIGYPIDLIQSFFQQILMSIGFMHVNKLTHTDLKVHIFIQYFGF